MKRRGFTLVELLVVLGMLGILLASMGLSVAKARERAKISKATQEAKEMTNAILAYEQYAKGHTLADIARGSWADCVEGSMSMILGGETGENGEKIPVLFNASLVNGAILDPWGTAYQFMVEKTATLDSSGSGAVSQLFTAPALPNFNRLSKGERGL